MIDIIQKRHRCDINIRKVKVIYSRLFVGNPAIKANKAKTIQAKPNQVKPNHDELKKPGKAKPKTHFFSFVKCLASLARSIGVDKCCLHCFIVAGCIISIVTLPMV